MVPPRVGAMAKGTKTCYYELLGVDRKCDVADIKTSYRKLALKMHPDKAHMNGVSVEEATKNFQEVQEAYSVLSDAQERAWYDAHREQILKGHSDEPAEDPFKTRINLYKYFSSSCYDGLGDSANGFFAVYSALFAEIDHEEAEWEDLDSEEDHEAMPPFGRSDSDPADVASFYRNWLDFCSRKAFGHADKWNAKEAPNRQVRRAMEMENKKARQAAKKEFNAEVRQLVKFVQKRDPRVLAQQRQQMKDSVDKRQRDLAHKEQRKSQEAAERKERQEAARLADEARWAEVEAERRARKEQGHAVSEDEDEDDEDEVAYVCEPCRKRFQSEKAFDQHAKSKKHLQVVAHLRRELERELKAEAEAAQAEAADTAAMEEGGAGDREESEEAPAKVGGAASKPSAAGEAKAEASTEEADSDDEDKEDEEDEEDAFLARFASRRGAGRAGGAGTAGRAAGGGGRGGFAPPARRSGAGGAAAEEPAGTSAGAGGSSSSSGGAGGRAGSDSSEEEDGKREKEEDNGKGEKEEDNGKSEKATRAPRRRPAAASAASPAAAEEAAGGRRAQKKAQQREVQLQRQTQKGSVQELVDGCRKAQRAVKRGEAGDEAADGTGSPGGGTEAAPAAEPAAAAASRGGSGKQAAAAAATEGTRCAVCGEDFSSRSKLFQHIKATGHAVLKPVAGGPLEAAGSGKKKKNKG